MAGHSKNKATLAGGLFLVDLKGFPPQGGDKLRLPQAHGKMKTALSDGFHFGGPEGIRTLDLSDANRTLSQLSYKPEYEVVWLRYVRLALPAELQARIHLRTLLLYTFPAKKQEEFLRQPHH